VLCLILMDTSILTDTEIRVRSAEIRIYEYRPILIPGEAPEMVQGVGTCVPRLRTKFC
jgi:hypothetical protein